MPDEQKPPPPPPLPDATPDEYIRLAKADDHTTNKVTPDKDKE